MRAVPEPAALAGKWLVRTNKLTPGLASRLLGGHLALVGLSTQRTLAGVYGVHGHSRPKKTAPAQVRCRFRSERRWVKPQLLLSGVRHAIAARCSRWAEPSL